MAKSKGPGSTRFVVDGSRLTRSHQSLVELARRPEWVAELERAPTLDWVLDSELSDHWTLPPGQTVLRSEDFVSLRVQLINLAVAKPAVAGQGATLRRKRSGAAYVVLHFPPQSIAEEVFYETPTAGVQDADAHAVVDAKGYTQPGEYETAVPPDKQQVDAPPIRSRIANWSHLVFRYDEAALAAAGIEAVPYTLGGLLDACLHLPLSIAPNAQRHTRRTRVESRFGQLSAAQTRSVERLSASARAQLAVQSLRNRMLLSRDPDSGSALVLRRAEVAPRLDLESTSPALQAALRTNSIESIAALGALSGAVLGVSEIAKIMLPLHPRRPLSRQTALELPFRLILSPNETARWKHATHVQHFAPTGHAELWHTRLGRLDGGAVREGPGSGTELRAIWARLGPDSDPPVFNDSWPRPASPRPLAESGEPQPFRMTLDDRDRFNIVHLSGNFTVPRGKREAIECRRLMLSGLGGWLDSRGAWQVVPDGLSVEEWVHRSTLARDHYVRVVYKGYLFPWGHRVSLVKVSERKFHKELPGNPAYLRQRMFLVVREFVRDYPAHVGKSNDGRHYHRQFPFSRIRITTVTTPDIDKPTTHQVGSHGQAMFWPVISGKPYRFQMIGTDVDGNEIEFAMPAIFIDNELANPVAGGGVLDEELRNSSFAEAREDWCTTSSPRKDWRTGQLRGQRLAFAASRKPGDTALETERVEFGAETEGLETQYVGGGKNPVCYPSLLNATVRIPALAYLSGGGSNEVSWNAGYLHRSDGFGPGELFVDVAGQGKLDFSKQGGRSGGFVQPNLAPTALSRLSGPISGTRETFGTGGELDPKQFFASLSPLLFGCIPLGDLIQKVVGVGANTDKLPKFIAEAATQVETLFNDIARLADLLEPNGNAANGLKKLAGEAIKAALTQAVDIAMADLKAQVQSLGMPNAIEVALQNVIGKAGTAVQDVVANLDSVPALDSALQPLLAALTALGSALTNHLTNLAAQQAAPNPAISTAAVAVIKQKFDEVKARVAQIQALIADIQRVPPLLQTAVALANALRDMPATPSELDALLSGGANALVDVLNTIGNAIAPFRDALEQVKLLDGSVKQLALTALGVIEDAAAAASTLAPLIESLLGDEIVVRFDWKPEIGPWPPANDDPLGLGTLFKPHDRNGFVVAVEARAKKSGGTPDAKVSCSLSHFDLILLGSKSGFMELAFDKIEFRAESSKKMDVDVVLGEIRFIGILSFVETLKDLIPLDGFSDPPALDISEQGIDASFSMALPNISVGIFSLSNLCLGAGFTVPFIGQPLAVRFHFCTREQPFNLSVSMLGGGGFFGVVVDPHGVQLLEAALEFGAQLSVDLGVASGSVHIMAGIYFRMEVDEASLTGYFRLGGEVDVMGLISASIELYMDLCYEFDSGKCVGTASLTIEVEVLVFSGSVTIRAQRKFAGSNGDPSFAALMGPAANDPAMTDQTEYPWREYCEAFAA